MDLSPNNVPQSLKTAFTSIRVRVGVSMHGLDLCKSEHVFQLQLLTFIWVLCEYDLHSWPYTSCFCAGPVLCKPCE